MASATVAGLGDAVAVAAKVGTDCRPRRLVVLDDQDVRTVGHVSRRDAGGSAASRRLTVIRSPPSGAGRRRDPAAHRLGQATYDGETDAHAASRALAGSARPGRTCRTAGRDPPPERRDPRRRPPAPRSQPSDARRSPARPAVARGGPRSRRGSRRPRPAGRHPPRPAGRRPGCRSGSGARPAWAGAARRPPRRHRARRVPRAPAGARRPRSGTGRGRRGRVGRAGWPPAR